ncbi:GDSL esterase/lipase At4g16230-like [Hibiscus syriacus]|uniref:GDSL esterase/lipase At4g16230-like n=1 Tax=Hibiscus syriacus TaxID=106335 RepID=UPI0019215EE0|nr:GDSL esterase/lipase At4g16230-like [Hibiscus syriacus]
MDHTWNMFFVCQVKSRISAPVILLLFDVVSAKKIPAIFVFGDSMVDAGNNNYIKTLAKATFPNGIDFCNSCPSGSGRFTNGRTVIDIIEQGLGAKDFRPPYLAPNTPIDVILKGVNYASSGSGILNVTGLIWGGRISLDEQISNFEETKATIVSTIGRRKAKRLLNHQALFIVVSGSNDFLLGQEIIPLKNALARGWYLNIMSSRFESQLRRLYYLEARKIIVTNIPRFGCIPFARDKSPNVKGCIPTFNGVVNSYNKRLKRLLKDLTTDLDGSIFVYANIHAMLKDILHRYKHYGFENVNLACCHTAGVHGGLLPCCSLSEICSNRTEYVFWDAFHLTETSNVIVARHLMDGGLKFMSPMNIRQLLYSLAVHLDLDD